jgi:hypothetical protein
MEMQKDSIWEINAGQYPRLPKLPKSTIHDRAPMKRSFAIQIRGVIFESQFRQINATWRAGLFDPCRREAGLSHPRFTFT